MSSRDSMSGRHPSVRMRWDNLLFLHWPVEPAAIRALIPAELELDLYDGRAWIALVPFRMEATRFRGFPPLPGFSSFYECNVRTYVRARDSRGREHAGVWFFSLDAERLLPVLGGNWLWSLNYIHSRFEVTHERDGSGAVRTTDYALSRRRDATECTRVAWIRGEPIPRASAGSIEQFLTERYWLFTRRRGRIMGGRIEHEPWSLRGATLTRLDDTLVRSAGVGVFGVATAPSLAWHSDTLEVCGWDLVPMDRVP